MVAVLAVAGLAVAKVGPFAGGKSDPGNTTVAQPEPEYEWADPQLDLPRDHQFVFDVAYDVEAKASELGMSVAEFKQYAFGVYTEPGLTRLASASYLAASGTMTIKGRDPNSGLDLSSGGASSSVQVSDGTASEWALHAEYYLVQRLDENGAELDLPVVTKFTIEHDLAAPTPTFALDEYGNFEFDWKPIDGADEYLIVKSTLESVDAGVSRTVRVIGRTDGTSWSSEESTGGTSKDYATLQNRGLELYDTMRDYGSTQDSSQTRGNVEQYEYGVIATDGASFSPYRSVSAQEVAGTLPYKFDRDEYVKQFGSDYVPLEELPYAFPIFSLDGNQRQAIVYLDPESMTGNRANRSILAYARGTMLGTVLNITIPDGEDAEDAIAEFNDKALKEAPKTGLTETADIQVAPEDIEDIDEIEEAPDEVDTEYPVNGSNEFTIYLAKHMIAVDRKIDLTEFVDKPGVPTLDDAIQEAVYQNPYVIGFDNIALQQEGDRIYLLVTYFHSKQEIVDLQKKVDAKVDEILDEIIDDGMSEREKVTEINDYLVDHGEYDHEGWDALLAGENPADYWYNQDVYGILLQGLGVCASYSKSFDILADAAGLDAVTVTGQVIDMGPHAWNKVKVDGKWYAVDVTWNDSPEGNLFLLVTDSELSELAPRQEDKRWMADLRVNDYATP